MPYYAMAKDLNGQKRPADVTRDPLPFLAYAGGSYRASSSRQKNRIGHCTIGKFGVVRTSWYGDMAQTLRLSQHDAPEKTNYRAQAMWKLIIAAIGQIHVIAGDKKDSSVSSLKSPSLPTTQSESPVS
jgi:hypothetical protein